MPHRLITSGRHALQWTENFGLLIIAIATIVAVGQEVLVMVEARTVHLADLLLLFIYLEVLAMIAAYLDSGTLPVRMPLYIAMVALARYLILDMKSLDSAQLLAVAGAILVIALAVLVVRYGHNRYPYGGNLAECREGAGERKPGGDDRADGDTSARR